MSVSTHSVEAVLARLTDTWGAGDAAGYAALFTDDATYVVFDGTVLRGRRAVEDVHRWLFDGPLRGSVLAGTDAPADVRYLRPDVAHVLVEGGVRPDGPSEPAPDRASVVSFVLVGTPDGWRVAAFQNTRVQAR